MYYINNNTWRCVVSSPAMCSSACLIHLPHLLTLQVPPLHPPHHLGVVVRDYDHHPPTITYLGIKDAPEQNPNHHQTPHHQQQDEEGLVLVLSANQLYAPREEERKYQEK